MTDVVPSRAEPAPADIELSVAHLRASFRYPDVQALGETYDAVDDATATTILDQAAAFAIDALVPLNAVMDRHGVRIDEDRVRTAPGHREAWATFVANGWPSIDHDVSYGGQQMPSALCLAVQELFDRACPAFGMLPVPQRAAARLIAAFADEDLKAALLPELCSGALGATICISEVGAGSDVLQMRTRATESDDGWTVTGEKNWISFGDHDLTSCIVHCVLARSDDRSGDRPEISLFLVEGGDTRLDTVKVLRVEEKLGLHGSPTCAIAFDGAPGILIGERGRGLAQMFVMITQMRLAVGAMGLGIAAACSDTALAYAKERRQGGPAGAPVVIAAHADVQRQLLELAARTELLRGLVLSVANLADIAAHATDKEDRERCAALVQWFLPIVKTFGANCAFANADDAIQVLGGAGYTSDWPVEQALRDARVLSVFEGTSGIQALDIVERRIVRDPRGMAAFVAQAREDGAGTALPACLDLLEDAAAHLSAAAPAERQAGATAFLGLAMQASAGWVAARFLKLADDTPSHRRMRAAAVYCLDRLYPRAALHHAEALQGSSPLAYFADLG